MTEEEMKNLDHEALELGCNEDYVDVPDLPPSPVRENKYTDEENRIWRKLQKYRADLELPENHFLKVQRSFQYED